MQKKDFKFSTSYNQFYISSDNGSFLEAEMNTKEDAYIDRLSIEKNAIIVFTQSYGDVKGEIEILEEPNTNLDYSIYDHIVEG